jgi:hypothetical protein
MRWTRRIAASSRSTLTTTHSPGRCVRASLLPSPPRSLAGSLARPVRCASPALQQRDTQTVARGVVLFLRAQGALCPGTSEEPCALVRLVALRLDVVPHVTG